MSEWDIIWQRDTEREVEVHTCSPLCVLWQPYHIERTDPPITPIVKRVDTEVPNEPTD